MVSVNREQCIMGDRHNKLSEIIPNMLYLCNWPAVEDKNELISNKITHILSISDFIRPRFPSEYTYKVVDVEDTQYDNIKQYF